MGKILVTGGAGFVGSRVVAALSARGADPVALVRQRIGTPADGKGEVVEGDYHQTAAMEQLLRRVQPASLVHAAWRLAPGSGYLDDPANVEELGASLRLFSLAKECGCSRIVGLGT